MADQNSSSETNNNVAVDESSLNSNKQGAKNQNEMSGDESTDHKPEDAKQCLIILKNAYDEKNFKLVDEIIEDMVSKSLVTGLKKIHTASGYGFAELIEKYIKEDKVDPNTECSFNDLTSITPLHFCAGIGPDPITEERDKCIQILVENGANVNHLTSRGDTALHWGTKLSDRKVCEKLVECGVDVNALNVDKCTCAHGAAFYKNIDILEVLIDSKVDVNKVDISGKNILHLLCKESFDAGIIIGLSSAPSEPNLNESSYQAKPSTEMSVKRTRFIDMIKRLLDEFKMNPNEKDLSEFTPVMYACEHSDVELLDILVNHKGDLSIINNEGVTCMLLAIVNSCTSTVKYLLDKGFDLKNNTSLNCSYVTDSAYLNDVDILKMLLEAGADVNETKQDENGVILNPLWAACERTNQIVVELLLEKGAKTVIKEDLKMTALHCTAMAQYESLPIAKLLVEHKCPINLKSTQAGETPLFLACNSGYSEIVEYLLELGVDPNDSSPITRTCFQQAIFRGHKDIIILLLNKNYVLTDDDKNDLNLFIMDLYQDEDTEMLNFLLKKGLTDKLKILECIKKVHTWSNSNANTSSFEEPSATNIFGELTPSVATLTELKLDLEHTYPNSVDELDVFLTKKCNLNASNSSEENEQLK